MTTQERGRADARRRPKPRLEDALTNVPDFVQRFLVGSGCPVGIVDGDGGSLGDSEQARDCLGPSF